MNGRADSYVRGDYAVLERRRLRGVWSITEAGTPPVELGEGSVGDVEALIVGAMRSLGADLRLSPDAADELFAHLCEQTLILRRRFNPEAGATVQFRPWLYVRLRFKVRDYYRGRFGRDGSRLPDDVIPDDLPEAAVEDAPFADDELESFLDRPDWEGALLEALQEHRELVELGRRSVAA